ncbi:hypothetical protein GS454_03695 [Rhodococcus hoagii]|nr:hypothetical protein [Prescottella equi]
MRDPEQSQLATMLAYLLLPEIVFLTIAATVTAVLNVSDSYAPAAWRPSSTTASCSPQQSASCCCPVR